MNPPRPDPKSHPLENYGDNMPMADPGFLVAGGVNLYEIKENLVRGRVLRPPQLPFPSFGLGVLVILVLLPATRELVSRINERRIVLSSEDHNITQILISEWF